jgi:hypothetical protein
MIFKRKICRISQMFLMKLSVLDEIISSQKYHLDKSGLEYNQTEKGSSSKTTEQETNPKSYIETIKEDRKIYKEDYKDTPPPR